MDVAQLLYELCEDERVFEPDIDLVEAGLLDSLAMIELFAALEDRGIVLQPTRIDHRRLRTIKGIESLIQEAQNKE